MKKVIFFIALLSLGLVACEGPAGRDGFDGQNGKDGFSNWDVYEQTVQANHWILSTTTVDEPGGYYYFDVVDSPLSDFIVTDGLVTVYYKYKYNEVWKYSPLPYVRLYNEDTNGDGVAEQWTETYDYEYSSGLIRIFVTRSDSKTSITPSESYFKIVYNW